MGSRVVGAVVGTIVGTVVGSRVVGAAVGTALVGATVVCVKEVVWLDVLVDVEDAGVIGALDGAGHVMTTST